MRGLVMNLARQSGVGSASVALSSMPPSFGWKRLNAVQKLPRSCHSLTLGLVFHPASQAEITWSLK
jgi:hypothetical protein